MSSTEARKHRAAVRASGRPVTARTARRNKPGQKQSRRSAAPRRRAADGSRNRERTN